MNRDARIRAVIKAIVRRLAEGYAPQKIILFGSYACGEPDEDSDVDLLIIKETSQRFLDRLCSARRIAAGADQEVPLELLVLAPTVQDVFWEAFSGFDAWRMQLMWKTDEQLLQLDARHRRHIERAFDELRIRTLRAISEDVRIPGFDVPDLRSLAEAREVGLAKVNGLLKASKSESRQGPASRQEGEEP